MLAAHEQEIHEQEHCKLSKHPCVFGCGEVITKVGMDAHIKKVRETSATARVGERGRGGV